MRMSQVSERIKEAPAQALRGLFAGIGQLLLITDKLRNKTATDQRTPLARAPEPSETAAASGETAAGRQAAATPVRAETQQAAQAAQAQPAEQAEPAEQAQQTGTAAAGATAATRGVTARAVETAGQPTAPLPNYDELSVASLRARLRNLDVTQVGQLAEYEKAHAGRADVIAMFERRIAKLEAGD